MEEDWIEGCNGDNPCPGAAGSADDGTADDCFLLGLSYTVERQGEGGVATRIERRRISRAFFLPKSYSLAWKGRVLTPGLPRGMLYG